MNNLLRTLTESNVKPQADLRLLLTTVREGRKQSVDNKLSDPFYDALEGLLQDLKTITLDNRDAEAFLKPVSKSEVPDYYDVIANPMDFGTMLKKVKQKQYKSKREFKDDLDLIWSNCFTYNASENHPLRQCVKRLKAKADRLLKHITDRRERTDPVIPAELGAGYTGTYPKVNGISRTHTRSPSYSSTKTSTPGLATIKSPASLSQQPTFRLDVPFHETSAIIRTPEGMARFYELDKEVAAAMKKPSLPLLQKLKDLVVPTSLVDDEVKTEDVDMVSLKEEEASDVDGSVGDKRKSQLHNDTRPRKRARFLTPSSASLASGESKDQVSELWWAAAQSNVLLANGVPPIPFGPASSEHKARPPSSSLSSYSLMPLLPSSSSTSSIPQTPKSTRRKKYKDTPMELDEAAPSHVDNPKALLNMMNSNIKTMRRIRHTHAKFAALNATTLANEETEEGGIGAGAGAAAGGPIAGPSTAGPSSANMFDLAVESSNIAAADDEILNEKVDERPWVMMVPGKGKGKGRWKGKEKVARAGGIEIGEKNAWECVQWADQKILEHVGFQGTSQVALDVLAGVMTEYLSNVGRTIKFLCDKFSTAMTPEEIILHTLFESGHSKVQDLEKYIRDDVERYTTRLNELEKKIVGAYRETAAGEMLEDEGLFEEEEEDETGALAVGEFADLLGEDYLGLRELGIAAEFGMSSLSIPRKLLKSKKNQHKPAAAKPSEPPPPYPPPPPFVLLTSNKLDDQIGLLKPFYTNRLTTLAATVAPPPPPPLPQSIIPPLSGPSLPGPSIGGIPGTLPGPKLSMPPLPGPSLSSQPLPPPAASAPASGLPSSHAIAVPGASSAPMSQPAGQQPSQPLDLASLPSLTLPDDVPNPVQTKMGPLGQITKGGGASASAKKKTKSAGAGASGTASGVGAATGAGAGLTGVGGSAVNGSGEGTETGPSAAAAPGPPVPPVGSVNGDGNSSPKKKKAANPGVGTGNGRKKKGSEGPSGSGQGQGSPSYPPVVVASA